MSLSYYYSEGEATIMEGTYGDDCLRTDFSNMDVSSGMLPGLYSPLGAATPATQLHLDASHTDSEASPLTPKALTCTVIQPSPQPRHSTDSGMPSSSVDSICSAVEQHQPRHTGDIEPESISLPALTTNRRCALVDLTNSTFLRKRRPTSHEDCQRVSPHASCSRSMSKIRDENSPVSRCPKRRKPHTPLALERAQSTSMHPHEHDAVSADVVEETYGGRQMCRSYSETNVQMGEDEEEPQHYRDGHLVGDGSRRYELTTIGKPKVSAICPSITGDTLSRLLLGEVTLERGYQLIDCRYPYEFKGGHISGAMNVNRPEHMMTTLFGDTATIAPTTVLIFYCEFSQMRGPRMAKSVRRVDRQRHDYPCLRYPQMYVLQSGYRAFHTPHAEQCTNGFVSMFDPRFVDDRRRFETVELCKTRAASIRRGKRTILK